MNIRLIASDLDDTLLDPDLCLTERTIRAVQSAANKGVPTVLATNRSYQATLPFIRQLGLTGPVIIYGGAQIRDCTTGNILRELSIPASLVKDCLLFAQAHHVYVQVHCDSNIFFFQHCEWSAWYENYIGYCGIESPDLLNESKSATKILILADAKLVPALLVAAQQEFQGKLWVTSSKPTFIELNHINASKGTALEVIATQYGIPRESIVAFGDQPQVDGGMLQYAGVGVAMGNADLALREIADLVTKSNKEDGVAMVLEDLLDL